MIKQIAAKDLKVGDKVRGTGPHGFKPIVKIIPGEFTIRFAVRGDTNLAAVSPDKLIEVEVAQ